MMMVVVLMMMMMMMTTMTVSGVNKHTLGGGSESSVDGCNATRHAAQG